MKYYFDMELNIYDEITAEDLLRDGKELKVLGYYSSYKEAESIVEGVYNILLKHRYNEFMKGLGKGNIELEDIHNDIYKAFKDETT